MGVEMAKPKFTPRRAFEALRAGKNEREAHLKTVATAQLLAWALLDQSPRRKRGKGRAFRTGNAKKAGLTVLMLLMGAHFKELAEIPDACSEAYEAMYKAFVRMGGFERAAKNQSASFIVKSVRSRLHELVYVAEICSYIIRYSKFGNGRKHHIQDAKEFAIAKMKNYQHEKNFKMSKVSQIWEKNKDSAPIIYVLFALCPPEFEQLRDPTEIALALERTASDHDAILRGIGQMASVADVLSSKMKNPRLKDYKGITRTPLSYSAFTEVELEIIEAIDRESPKHNP
jgi:hypothetical protein